MMMHKLCVSLCHSTKAATQNVETRIFVYSDKNGMLSGLKSIIEIILLRNPENHSFVSGYCMWHSIQSLKMVLTMSSYRRLSV